MTPTERLTHKRHSLDKWLNIAQRVRQVPLEEEPEINLGNHTCGYCTIYFYDDCYRIRINACSQCPLNTEALCRCGDGEAYRAAANFINAGYRNQQAAIAGADAMCEAIRLDIEREEKLEKEESDDSV